MFNKYSAVFLILICITGYLASQNPLNLSYKGMTDGHHISYYDNGNKQGDMVLKNGNLEGEHIVYYSNGVVENYDQFEHGMFHGLSYKLSNKGDTIRRSFYAHDTVMYDKAFWYYPSGSLKTTRLDIFYSNSPWGREVFKNARITRMDVNWNSKQQFDSSSYCLVTEYFENGNMKSVSEYLKDVRDGVYQEYHSNGMLKIDAVVRDNEYEGTYMEYFPDGTKKVEAFCVKGKYHGAYKEFTPDGELKKTTMFENGQKKD